jgi:heme/copper-type cytochrome/quinol oxidase subunit 4
METRNGLITFGLFVLLAVFTFVFCLGALATPDTPNMTYGVLALIGFVVCIIASLFNGSTARQNGEALAVWFTSYAVVVSIVFVWFLTRCGSAFKLW